MTSLALPSQSAMPLANSAAAANALASDRSAGGQPDSQESSAFAALLGALDDSSPQTHPASGSANGTSATGAPLPAQLAPETLPAATSWRSVSAVHSLGSGVLIALDKRLDSTATGDPQPASSKTLKANADDSTDASTLATIGWASLVGGMTGATTTPTAAAPTAAATTAGLTSAPLIGKASVAASAPAAGAAIQDVMPSDAAPAATAQTVALNAGTAPVDVKVVRSITYLGLDTTARNVQAATSAPSRSTAAGSSTAASLQTAPENNAPVALPNAQGDSSAMSSGDQRKQNTHDASVNESASAKIARATQEATSDSGQAAPAVVTGVTQASLSAMPGNSLPSVPIAQLADVVASVAQQLDSSSGDATSSAATANTADAARMSPIKELDVQLNPASLGSLSIEMRLSNGNLNVTIKAEKPDTLKLIDNERGAISDKLKSLNFSVESLTVKASDAVASGSASADSSNTGTSGYGEAQQGQSGQTADGSGNGRSLQGQGDQRQSARQNRANAGEPGGDSNFGHRVV
ncbi:flagellar hook-length control protein FliK [Methylocapsa sp. S129]|uniref:flagellar hook-length control protein FliK n=1 Tax=Methylocapsa sp. S129 TaxID=1641869 RepID=UPI00131CA193|nr:flagellar hook-length control protein FliK [Methylocapsa sp. S129]